MNVANTVFSRTSWNLASAGQQLTCRRQVPGLSPERTSWTRLSAEVQAWVCAYAFVVFCVPRLPCLLCAMHSRAAAPRICVASLCSVLHVSCTVLQLPGEQVCPSAASQSSSYGSTRSCQRGRGLITMLSPVHWTCATVLVFTLSSENYTWNHMTLNRS